MAPTARLLLHFDRFNAAIAPRREKMQGERNMEGRQDEYQEPQINDSVHEFFCAAHHRKARS
jgi:hypothetical protein